jgi:Tfp pilus assembly PilM family ATPase
MHQGRSRLSFKALFPPPDFMRMPAAGLDVGNQHIRFVECAESRHGTVLSRWVERKIPTSVFFSDDLATNQDMRKIFQNIRNEFGLNFVRLSLPEDRSYLFRTVVPVKTDAEIRSAIELQLEENVPLTADEAIFDYTVIERGVDFVAVSVAVFPKRFVENTTQFLLSAGLTPVGFHLTADATAKAVIKEGDQSTYLVVHFSEKSIGLYIVSQGVLQFTSNLPFGGEVLTDAIARHFSVDTDEAIRIKKSGDRIRGSNAIELFYSVAHSASVLKDEMMRVIDYWENHKIKDQHIGKKIDAVILTGADANIPGFDEYLSLSVGLRVDIGNVWTNLLSFDDSIPALPLSESLNYGAAIGLMLQDKKK